MSNMIIRWYIGTGKRQDGSTLTHQRVRDSLNIALSRVSMAFGGATITFGEGSWHDGAKLVEEPCAIIETIVTVNDAGMAEKLNQRPMEVARGIAYNLASNLDQSEVLVTSQFLNEVCHVPNPDMLAGN